MIYETVKSILFYLDTRYRSGGTIGAPQFTFPNNLIGLMPQAGEQIRLTLQEAAINYTFYQTEAFNNKFVLIEESDTQRVARVVEIEIGNYNLNTFILEITNKLNQNSQFSYVVTFNANQNTLTYLASPKGGNSIVEIQFDFNSNTGVTETGVDIQESSNEIMGFPIGSTVTFDIAGGGRTVTSTVPITMSPGAENLYVTVTNECSNYGNASVANVFTSSNVLAKIPVASVPYSTLYFFDLNSNFSTIISNKYLDNLNMRLLNERFTQIEPRKNWSFTVKIEIIRPKVEGKLLKVMEEMLELTRLKFLNKSKNDKNTLEKKPLNNDISWDSSAKPKNLDAELSSNKSEPPSGASVS